jgi:hypothetical protein
MTDHRDATKLHRGKKQQKQDRSGDRKLDHRRSFAAALYS